MVEAYWQMGKRIVEQEQQGKDRADYGSQLLKSLSKELTAEFGKGFSVNSLYYFRQFYLAFPEKLPTAWGILTWSHYKRLLSVSNADARAWYLKEAAEQMWSYRTLDRNIGSQYYERLLLSQHKENVDVYKRQPDIGLFRLLANKTAATQLLDPEFVEHFRYFRFVIGHAFDELSDVDAFSGAERPYREPESGRRFSFPVPGVHMDVSFVAHDRRVFTKIRFIAGKAADGTEKSPGRCV